MEKPWSQLPDDIIYLLIDRLLSYADYVRFRAVCKNWRDAANNMNGFNNVEKLPWLMAYNSSSCFLYDPYHERQYTVYSGDASKAKIFSANTRVLVSKYGWVLFHTIDTSSFFFYNPFTDKIIQLPELPELSITSNARKRLRAATFSTTPNSPDCHIFIIRAVAYVAPIPSDKFYSNICKLGEEQWTEFMIYGDYGPSIYEAEYVDGVFYCCTVGAIGAFDVATKTWNLLPYPELGAGTVFCRHYLIDCDRELLLAQNVCFYPHYQWRWRVMRCDRSQWKWFQVESLEKRSLFLSRSSSMCIPVASEFANKIAAMYPDHARFFPYQYQQYQYQYEANPWCQPHFYPYQHEVSLPPCQPHIPQILQIYDWNIGELRKFWIQQPL